MNKYRRGWDVPPEDRRELEDREFPRASGDVPTAKFLSGQRRPGRLTI